MNEAAARRRILSLHDKGTPYLGFITDEIKSDEDPCLVELLKRCNTKVDDVEYVNLGGCCYVYTTGKQESVA